MTTRSPTLSLAPAPYTAVQVVADIPKVLARLDQTPCLTPTLKAKRAQIVDRNASALARIYEGH